MHTLTVDQLETAAADLRNSSMIIEHLGRCTGTLFNDQANVCQVGAIELATTRQLQRPRNHWAMLPVSDDVEVMDPLRYRAQNAINVLSAVIPGDLCQRCCDSQIAEHLSHGRTCKVCEGFWEPRDPWDRVTHYNDCHVLDDEILHRLIELAADRALLAAAEKRSLVSGERLLVGA